MKKAPSTIPLIRLVYMRNQTWHHPAVISTVIAFPPQFFMSPARPHAKDGGLGVRGARLTKQEKRGKSDEFVSTLMVMGYDFSGSLVQINIPAYSCNKLRRTLKGSFLLRMTHARFEDRFHAN